MVHSPSVVQHQSGQQWRRALGWMLAALMLNSLRCLLNDAYM